MKLKDWFYVCLFFFSLMSIGFLLKAKDDAKLKACSKEHTAILKRKYRAGKKKHVELTMVVDGKELKSHHSLSNFTARASIGDTINVIYACSDPSIVEVVDKLIL